jgi:hypothetical protein
MAYDPERSGEQKLEDKELGKALDRAHEEINTQRKMGAATIDAVQTERAITEKQLGEKTVQAAAYMEESEEEEMSM